MKILLINGPNLNMLGERDPATYGADTLSDIIRMLESEFPEVSLDTFQSNHEGAIIDRIHQAYKEEVDGLMINGGALTHYSYALLDALHILTIPKIELHMSHIFAREAFRHQSVISPACHGMISGFGKYSYFFALHALVRMIKGDSYL